MLIFFQQLRDFLFLFDKRNNYSIFKTDFKSISLLYLGIPLGERLSERLVTLYCLVVIGGPRG